MFKFNKIWLGPEEETYNEGFDDLFAIAENYEIPPAPAELKEKKEHLEKNQFIAGEKKGVEGVMDRFFNRNRENKEEIHMQDEMLMPQESKPSLTVVQGGSNMPVNEVIVVEPRSFEDSLELVNHLKARKSVILNLQYLDNEVSQRVIDFISGATHALGGTQQRVGNGVFVFAPTNYKIETESESTREYREMFAKTFGI